jgi:iron-sulfur cluster assembly protein
VKALRANEFSSLRQSRFTSAKHITSAKGASFHASKLKINPTMSVSLTPAAAKHVTKYLAKRGKGVGVRLGVKTTGCSGLAYKLEYVDEVASEDVLFETEGIKLMVDPKSLAYLDGTTLDYVREGLNEGFRFNNPNERDKCGCGESFRV